MLFQIAPKFCPICFKESKFKAVENYQSKEGKFSLYECLNCKVQFWMPFRGPGGKWYEKNEENKKRTKIYKKEEISLIIKNSWNTCQFLLHPPHKNPFGKTLLDIGCGTGGFLLEAQKIGYKVYGIDFDKNQINIAKNLGLKGAIVADIFNFLKKEKNKNRFDVITGFEVIEHLDRPKEFLNLIFQSLKPGGYLALSAPNRERFWGNIKESYDFPYHHLIRFNIDSLKNLVIKNGFKIIKAKEQIPTDYFISKARVGFGLWLRKVIKFFQKKRLSEMKKANQIINYNQSDFITKIGHIKDKIVTIFIFLPAFIAFKVFQFKGTGLYILAQKDEKNNIYL